MRQRLHRIGQITRLAGNRKYTHVLQRFVSINRGEVDRNRSHFFSATRSQCTDRRQNARFSCRLIGLDGIVPGST